MASPFLKRISDLARQITNLSPRAGSVAPAPALSLAAFGKHPGWDDHIPDTLGLEGDRLVLLKQLIYEGIGGNVDSGAWEKLSQAGTIEPFDHVFLWRPGADPGNGRGAERAELAVGRLWHSKDGKGRDRYPMVVAAYCAGLPLAWVAGEVLPRLGGIREACAAATDAAGVTAALDAARHDLRERVGRSPYALAARDAARASAAGGAPAAAEASHVDSTLTGPADAASAVALLAARPEMGEGHVGLLRILYQIERELAAYRAGGAEGTSARAGQARPQQLRVPRCADSAPASATLWTRFILGQLSPAAPVLVVAPERATWADILVGPMSVPQLFSLRAPPSAVALSNEIPYELEATFLARVERYIDECRARASAAGPGST